MLPAAHANLPGHGVRMVTIVSVTDGDSLRALTQEGREIRVRLDGVDAPELDQEGGEVTKRALENLCPVGEPARLRTRGRDHYGRVLARVECRDRPVGVLLVAHGLAWATPWRNQDSEVHLIPIQQAQRQARAAGVGLWAHPDPTPPWEWRRMQRENRSQPPHPEGWSLRSNPKSQVEAGKAVANPLR